MQKLAISLTIRHFHPLNSLVAGRIVRIILLSQI
jgi:hypothetical protein